MFSATYAHNESARTALKLDFSGLVTYYQLPLSMSELQLQTAIKGLNGSIKSLFHWADAGGFICSSNRAFFLQRLLWLLWLTLCAATAPARAAEANLTASTDVSNEGYFVLSWQSDTDADELLLQQANSTDFNETIDRSVSETGAVTITGLGDGDYYFRLTNSGQTISESIHVAVQHHSLARAGSFFLLGLVLFSILIITILTGNRRTVS